MHTLKNELRSLIQLRVIGGVIRRKLPALGSEQSAISAHSQPPTYISSARLKQKKIQHIPKCIC